MTLNAVEANKLGNITGVHLEALTPDNKHRFKLGKRTQADGQIKYMLTIRDIENDKDIVNIFLTTDEFKTLMDLNLSFLRLVSSPGALAGNLNIIEEETRLITGL